MSYEFAEGFVSFVAAVIPYILVCRLLWELIKYFKNKNKEK